MSTARRPWDIAERQAHSGSWAIPRPACPRRPAPDTQAVASRTDHLDRGALGSPAEQWARRAERQVGAREPGVGPVTESDVESGRVTGDSSVFARGDYRSAGSSLTAKNNPCTVLPLQHVEAAVFLRNRIGISQPSIQRHQDLAVHRVMADHNHCTAEADAGRSESIPCTARSRDHRSRLDARCAVN